MKHGHIFSFLDGTLFVMGKGYDQPGWGQFSFDEEQAEFIPHEEKDGCRLVIDIPPSELIALRDFLNKRFPASASTKCAHNWKVKVQKSKTVKTCRKCGIRMYKFNKPACPSPETTARATSENP